MIYEMLPSVYNFPPNEPRRSYPVKIRYPVFQKAIKPCSNSKCKHAKFDHKWDSGGRKSPEECTVPQCECHKYRVRK